MFIFNINFTLTQFSPFPHFCCNILTSSSQYFYKPHNMLFMLISIKFYSDPASLFSFFNTYLFPRGPIDKLGEGLGYPFSISVPWGYSNLTSQISWCTFRGYKTTSRGKMFKRNTKNSNASAGVWYHENILILKIFWFWK